MLSAHLWDHAKAARMIAAFGNFQISRVRRRESKPRRVVIGNVIRTRVRERKIDIVMWHGHLVRETQAGSPCHNFFYDRSKLTDLIQSDKRIHLRHFVA